MICTANSLHWPLGTHCHDCGHHALAHPGTAGTTVCTTCEQIAATSEQRSATLALNRRIDDLDELLEAIRQHEAAWSTANEELEERLTDVRRQMDDLRTRAPRDLKAPEPRAAASPPGGWYPATHQPVGMIRT